MPQQPIPFAFASTVRLMAAGCCLSVEPVPGVCGLGFDIAAGRTGPIQVCHTFVQSHGGCYFACWMSQYRCSSGWLVVWGLMQALEGLGQSSYVILLCNLAMVGGCCLLDEPVPVLVVWGLTEVSKDWANPGMLQFCAKPWRQWLGVCKPRRRGLELWCMVTM